ncbi:MAG: HDOD domain-containing protein [Pseudomonadota bacterium]
MGDKSLNIKPGLLKPFVPFSDMPPEYVIVAAKFGEELKLEDGDILLEKTATDPSDFFLIDGELTLTDIYDRESTLRAKTPHALKPLPQLRPSAYDIKSVGATTVIRIPQEVISRVKADAPEKEIDPNDEALLDITQTREFFEEFKEELHLHHVRLPSIRPSASMALRVTAKDEMSDEELVDAISLDPGIAAKLLKIANSSLFSAEGPVQDIQTAVERLGSFPAKEITACFAFRDVFKNMSPELNGMLQEQVEASRQVSAMATVIAEMTNTVNPQTAAMAGLLHNVGVLPVFGYATRNIAYGMNSKLVARAIERLAHEVGVMIAMKWSFGDDVIKALKEGTNWDYDPGEQADLASVILTAKYHYFLSKNGVKGLPKPKEVPSLNAVSRGNFDEAFSFKILEGARV